MYIFNQSFNPIKDVRPGDQFKNKMTAFFELSLTNWPIQQIIR